MVAVNDNTIQWEKTGAGNAKYIMQKTDSLHITFVFPEWGHKAVTEKNAAACYIPR